MLKYTKGGRSLNKILTETEERSVVDLTKELIKRPSSVWDDESVYRYVYDYLKEREFEVQKGNSAEYAFEPDTRYFNVIAKKGNGKGPKVLLNGHLDTVSPKGEWYYPKYDAKEIDGKIFGLGAADMKAGCAVAIQTFETIVDRFSELNGELFLSLVYGEESPHSFGSDELLRQFDFSDYDLIIVTEPSPELSKDVYCLKHQKMVKNPKFPVVVIGAEGRELFELKFYGKNTHASHPKRGINALQDAARVITDLINFNKFTDIKTGRGDYVVLNIEGGDESFTVPGYCRVAINRQLGIGETVEGVEREIKQIIKSLNLKSKVVIDKKYSPSEDVEYRPYLFENCSYIDELIKIINRGKKKKKKCQYISSSIGDFNLFGVRTKVPTLVFGPGGGNIHSANEYVNRQDIVDSTEYLTRLLMSIYGTEKTGGEENGMR